MTFVPEDFEKVFRSEGAWPRRTGMDSFVYYRKQQRPEYFHGYGGLLAEQGEDWQKMRTIVNPIMMQPKIIKLYIDKVDAIAQEFMHIVQELRDERQELPDNFNEWLNRWALETMGVLVLDTRLGVLNRDQTPEVSKLVTLTKDAVTLFYQLDVLPSLWRKVKTPGFYRLMRTLDDLYHLIAGKIDEAVQRMEKNPSADSDTLSILEKLLKVDRKAAFIMSLDSLFAGVDTTSSGSVGVLYCLAQNPDKQDKLREELRSILPDKNSPLTPANMKNMPYLRACIKEGLRLYPPTPGNGRCAGKNLVLQGYQIPKGVLIGMGQLVLQREEGHFTKASSFIPERWLGKEAASGCPSAKEVHPFVYMPFGFGARSCVGRRLAMMEMEILVSRMVRQYNIRWNYDELRYKASIVNIPANDLKFQLTEVVEMIDPEWSTAKPLESIPGPNRWQLFIRFSKGGRYAGIDFIDVHRLFRKDYGTILRLPGMMGRKEVVLSFLPEDFEIVYRTEGVQPERHGFETMAYYKHRVRPDIFKGMGGLVTDQAESWQKTRTIVNPVMMQPKTLKRYVEQVDEVAREFMTIVSNFRDENYEAPADFARWINRWALETIGMIALDTRFGVLNSDTSGGEKQLVGLVREMFDLLYNLDVLPSIWKYYKTSNFKRLMQVFDELTAIVRARVAEADIRFENHPRPENEQSLLEKMLKIDKHVAMIMAFDMIMAGIDTTSALSAATLYCLATNPDKQAKLRKELLPAMPHKDSPLNADNMRNMPYLRACIKEAIRMFPVVAGNVRTAGRDIVLQGYRIPKGTNVIMSNMLLMRDESIYTRANDYLPERWLSDRDADIPSIKDTHPFTYTPFGFGPRSCIGKRLAMMELEVIVSRMIRQFEFRWNYMEYKVSTKIINGPGSPLRFEMKDVKY
ncbi:cytochrome P450 CYP12A2-like [Anopheles nili]|uniref:cytochrome P450 CYP12A2-like n=1 Tax=Anopheles nili TaxID=185578 RepID=UPI00237AC52A|nr:cytochrome P450 CYP12A2-like [Anopheles nili]